MSLSPSSVSQLVFDVKSCLESRYRQVLVEGEISNISKTVAGHVYFSLSDEKACVKCALFRGDAMRNVAARKMKDGDRIIVAGSVGVYAKRGVFQVVAKRISPAGRGDLAFQFELLKEKLSKKGYFDASAKKTLPKFPGKIAVITAPYGAALQDFLNVMKRRSLWHHIVIVPAVVQGEASAASLVKAMRAVQEMDDVDVILLTRGGGAMEDLWSFNDERLIEEIYNCPIPVISAVGHQVDNTLSDFAADLRMETPSAAAEFLSQPHTQIRKRLSGSGRNLKGLLYRHQHEVQKRLARINPANLARGLQMRLAEFKHRLGRVELLKNQERYLGLADKEMLASDALERGRLALERILESSSNRLEMSGQVLRPLNPENTLKRGYCYVESGEKRVIAKHSEYDKLKKNESVKIHFADGVGGAKKI